MTERSAAELSSAPVADDDGLHTFAMGWGLVSSRRALKQLEGAARAVFFVLLAMSWGVIYALYEAGA